MLGECVKVTVLLICSIFDIHCFFFFSQSSFCALFFTIFLYCSYNCSSTVSFFQSSVCIFFFFYIYCYTDTINFTIFSQLLRCQFHYRFSVLALFIKCFCTVNLQCHFGEPLCPFFFSFFFFFKFSAK